MDHQKLADLLRATIDPNQREEAEKHLEQIHKIIGFAPTVLTVVMNNNLDMPVRQAGVIYLKNMISHFWEEVETPPGESLKFHIHEQDRAMIREAIVDAVVHAPDLVRVQLAVCVQTIVRHDFPGRWSNIVDKVSIYLQSPDISGWMGAFLCMYQLVKHYEFKEINKRVPLNEALKLLLPLTHQRLVELLPNQSEQSVLLQKLILKIFQSYVEYFLCTDILTQEVFHQWIQVAQEIIKRPVPEATNTIDEDERPSLVWWKCKKWASRFVYRVFSHYGSPGKIQEKYSQFADFYLQTYTTPMIEVMLQVLDQQQKKIYVSPRVLQYTFNYLTEGVPHSIAWKLMKPHIIGIIQEVIYPLMCHTKEDEELWESDPYEYIRMKFDIFADYLSHVNAAQGLLHTVAKKRKGVLTKIMMSVREVITNQHSTPSQIDGALHITGTVADLLLKKETFKDQMEVMIMGHVVPLFDDNNHPYLKARACWMVQRFARTDFKAETNLHLVVEKIISCLIGSQDLPVKVEAAIALKDLLRSQDKVEQLLAPHIQQITMEILKILRESEADDLTTVMETIVGIYSEHLVPLALQITEHMATTFNQLLESDERADDKVVTAMGILSTLGAIIAEFEQHPNILIHVENIIINILKTIFSQSLLEFYDEAFDLICSLTCDKISPQMWAMFDVLYEVFQSSACEYFLELMPSLHNFVTVDPDTFLSNEKNLLVIYNMCKTMLTGNPGEDAECHAAKLLEVTLLQYKGKIDSCVPSFIDLALQRLLKPIVSSELRVMCIQVVVAALFYNPTLLFELLEKIRMPNTTESITAYFIKQWIQDTDCFMGIHDRKICVLGFCELLLTTSNRHQAISNCARDIIPAIIVLFDGLKLAYSGRAQAESQEEGVEYESDEDDPGLATDEDDLEDEDAAYLQKIISKAKASSPFPVTSATITNPENGEEQNNLRFLEDSDDEEDECPLEMYTTPLDDEACPIDEYTSFKNTLQQIQNCDPNWYNAVTQHLSDEQKKSLNDVFVLSEQRRAAAESKRIEQSGGYSFQNQAVPASFNFTSPR